MLMDQDKFHGKISGLESRGSEDECHCVKKVLQNSDVG